MEKERNLDTDMKNSHRAVYVVATGDRSAPNSGGVEKLLMNPVTPPYT